jgi:transcription initiation factor IIE alpha subunit
MTAKTHTPHGEAQQQVLAVVREQGPVQHKDVQAKTGLASGTVSTTLRDLREAGQIASRPSLDPHAYSTAMLWYDPDRQADPYAEYVPPGALHEV